MKNPVAIKEETNRDSKSLPVLRPAAIVQKLHDDVDKLLEDFTAGLGSWRHLLTEPMSECQPKMNVKDTGTEIVITAELPGVEMHDLDITATPHYVSIAGEKRIEEMEKHKGYYRWEREYGFFRRVLPMPCEIEKDRVDAVLRNGVLTVTLPKTKTALEQERKVTVKAG